MPLPDRRSSSKLGLAETRLATTSTAIAATTTITTTAAVTVTSKTIRAIGTTLATKAVKTGKAEKTQEPNLSGLVHLRILIPRDGITSLEISRI